MYAKSRQIDHVRDIGIENIDNLTKVIERYFGKKWLESEGDNPIQDLWKRPDHLSTSQLLLLGNAIDNLSLVDASWVADQVRQIKSGSPNNRKGAAFELFGLSLFKFDGIYARPTKRNHPGYDALITLPSKVKVFASLKNYGLSSHEGEFNAHCRKLEDALKRVMRDKGISGASFRAIASAYPTINNWSKLIDEASRLESSDFNTDGKLKEIADIWHFGVFPPSFEAQPLSSEHHSYHMNVLAPYHQNEHRNFISKLESAAANAKKHAHLIEKDAARAILMRVPERFSLRSCETWAEEYIESNQSGPIDVIMLYQMTVTSTASKTSILHSFTGRSTVEYLRKLKWPGSTIVINPLIGSVSNQSAEFKMLTDQGMVDIPNMYNFQSGQYFTLFIPDKDGCIEANTNLLAPGVVRHAVVRPNGQPGFTISGIFPPTNILTVLD